MTPDIEKALAVLMALLVTVSPAYAERVMARVLADLERDSK